MDDQNQQAKGHPAPSPGDDQPKDEGAPPTPSIRRTIRLAPALALSVAVLLATAVALSAWHGFSTAREVTAELMRNRAELVIDSLATLTRQYMEPPRQQIEYVAKLVDRGEISGDDLGEMSDYLAGALAGTPQVRGIAYIRPSGDVLRVRRAEGDIRVRLSNWSDNPETARRLEWAKSTRETRWGRLIFAERSGRTLINLQKPLWVKDSFKGLLVAVVPITSLSRFVSRLKIGGGNSFILLGSESVLAHHFLTKPFSGLSDSKPVPGLTEIGDPVLAKIWSHTNTGLPARLLAGSVEGHAARVGLEDYVYIYQVLGEFGEQPWVIGTYFRALALGAPFARLTWALLAGGGIIVIGVILSLLLGRAVARPAQHLARAAGEVRDFRFSDGEPLPGSALKELNEAHTAFNAMRRGLVWFENYVPRRLVHRLVGEGGEIPLAETEVTVMFTDIVGFTGLAESLGATGTAELLNHHFTIVADAIEKTGGIVDKYMGDSVMAFWNAPDIQPRHAEEACRTALNIAHRISDENERRVATGAKPIRMRIGIHTGPAVAGNIGAEGRINYTIVGDTVNIAQRLEELAKTMDPAQLGHTGDTAILISGQTAAVLGPGFRPVPLGAQRLRGHEEEVEAFRLG